MPPDGTTAVNVPLALDAVACTELPVPVSTARASSTPEIGLSLLLMKFSALNVGDARIHRAGGNVLARIDLQRTAELALGESRRPAA